MRLEKAEKTNLTMKTDVLVYSNFLRCSFRDMSNCREKTHICSPLNFILLSTENRVGVRPARSSHLLNLFTIYLFEI